MVNTSNINYSQINGSPDEDATTIALDEESLKLFASSDKTFEEQLDEFEDFSANKLGSSKNEIEENYSKEKNKDLNSETNSEFEDFGKLFNKDEQDDESDLVDAEKVFRDLGQQAKLIQELYKQFDSNSNNQLQNDKLANSKLNELINSLRESPSKPLADDPSIILDKQNLKLTMNFPATSELKSVQVQYDPSSRSIVAEMFTSQEAARILQNQVSVLERNLAKHDIKLQSLKINGTEGNRSNQERQENKNNKNKSQDRFQQL